MNCWECLPTESAFTEQSFKISILSFQCVSLSNILSIPTIVTAFFDPIYHHQIHHPHHHLFHVRKSNEDGINIFINLRITDNLIVVNLPPSGHTSSQTVIHCGQFERTGCMVIKFLLQTVRY